MARNGGVRSERSTLPDAVVRVDSEPVHPVQTHSGRVQVTLFDAPRPCPAPTGQAGRDRERRTAQAGWTGSEISAPAPPSLSGAVPEQPGTRLFDVYAIDVVTGPGKWLARVEALSISAAEKIAKHAHGSSILVTPAMGSIRRAQRTTAQELARKASSHRRRSR